MIKGKFNPLNRSRLRTRKKEVKASVRKSGIKTIEGVLNTSILSDHCKVNYIRHRFTCYNNFLLTFYKDKEGINLRKQLNEIIRKVVNREVEVSELIEFDKELRIKLKEKNKTKKVNDKEIVSSVQESKKVDFSEIPEIPGLTENEKTFLKTIPVNWCSRKLTEENKVEMCMKYINTYKENWKKCLCESLKNKKVNGYLVEMYLEHRSAEFYPKDFSDLDFIKWDKLINDASLWLYHKLDDDKAKAQHFICTILPKWIENNAENFKSEILE